jgi:hypothetical protein
VFTVLLERQVIPREVNITVEDGDDDGDDDDGNDGEGVS